MNFDNFGKLGECYGGIKDPKSYLFRIAINIWIDIQRRKNLVSSMEDLTYFPSDIAEIPLEVKDALTTLSRKLPPKERVSVLLVDVFNYSLRETADFLETNIGAVKAALLRGRTKLKQDSAPQKDELTMVKNTPEKLIDSFMDAFNKKDIKLLANLMMEDASAVIQGVLHEYGRDSLIKGSMEHTLSEEIYMKVQRVNYMGENILLHFYNINSKDVLVDVFRLEFIENKMSRLDYYYFSPEVLQEIGKTFSVPIRTNSYYYKG